MAQGIVRSVIQREEVVKEVLSGWCEHVEEKPARGG